MERQMEIICRCEEVTRGEIEDAVADGRRSLSGIKKQTRAGMGACQGRTCSRLVQRILAEKGVCVPADAGIDTPRTPVVPVRIGSIPEEEKEQDHGTV